mmetsp:Transcript_7925/g.20156  ORF Transcript_7925/g.20156 Transcript_7925/m.20156 type:complete len:294 (+) Transcript_7925:393-1274(+)
MRAHIVRIDIRSGGCLGERGGAPCGDHPRVLRAPQQQHRRLDAAEQCVHRDAAGASLADDAVEHLRGVGVVRGRRDGVHQGVVDTLLVDVHHVEHLLDAQRLLGQLEGGADQGALEPLDKTLQKDGALQRWPCGALSDWCHLNRLRLVKVARGVQQHQPPHQLRVAPRRGEAGKPAQAVAHQHHRLLAANNLQDKLPQLLHPHLTVRHTHRMEGSGRRDLIPQVQPPCDRRGKQGGPASHPPLCVVHHCLLAPAKAQQARRVHTVALGQLRDVVPPVVGGGSETMHQHDRRPR